MSSEFFISLNKTGHMRDWLFRQKLEGCGLQPIQFDLLSVGPLFLRGGRPQVLPELQYLVLGASRTVAEVLVDSGSFCMGCCFVKVVLIFLWMVLNAKETSGYEF